MSAISYEEINADLNRICANCGEYKGRHKAGDLYCPVVEDGRTIGYKNFKHRFKDWEDSAKAEGGEL